MSKDIKLLPCPFCASRAQECYKDCGLYECSNVNCELNSSEFEAKEWNTRHTEPQQVNTIPDMSEAIEEIDKIKSYLIKTSASMVLQKNMPSGYIEDYENVPKKTLIRFWRSVCGAILKGNEFHKRIGAELRGVHNKLTKIKSILEKGTTQPPTNTEEEG